MDAHFVELRVFSKPEDNKEDVLKGFMSFLPFDFEVKQKNALGFNEREICVISGVLEKQRHISLFLKSLIERLSAEQKQKILEQAESRIDDNCCMYLRFDKDKLIKETMLWLTDMGNCYHIKMTLAAFPKKKEKAIEILKEIFS
ncbi:MAG: RNA-binding domain-containing protein [Candidatus Woesearchaeota archaeon]